MISSVSWANSLFSGSSGYNVWLFVESKTHTGIQVTSVNRQYLGAALGSTSFMDTFTQQCISEWVEGVFHLSSTHITQLFLMDTFLSGIIIIFVLLQTFPIYSLHLNLQFGDIFFLS